MTELELLSCAETASFVTARGPVTSTRAIQGWLERHPDLRIKVGGKCRLHVDDVKLILSGLTLAEVAARRRVLKAAIVASTNPQHKSLADGSRADRRPARRQSASSDSRRRG